MPSDDYHIHRAKRIDACRRQRQKAIRTIARSRACLDRAHAALNRSDGQLLESWLRRGRKSGCKTAY